MSDPIVLLTDPLDERTALPQYATMLAAMIHAPLLQLSLTADDLTPEAVAEPVALNGHPVGQAALLAPEKRIAPSQAAPVLRRHHPQLLVLNRPAGEAAPAMVRARAADLLAGTPYPLLVVPPDAPTTPPRRIAIAVDGADFNIGEAAVLVRQLLRAPGASLTVLHVTQPTAPLHGHDALASVDNAGLLPFPLKPNLLNWIHRVPATGILDAAHDAEADLLLMVARRRNFWGNLLHTSVTAEVLGRCPLPVMVLATVSAE